MMDNQKQIEEIARTTCNYNAKNFESCVECTKGGLLSCDRLVQAEKLYKAGYRKIHENEAMLTREELFRDSTQLSKEKQIEIIHNIILENLDYGYEETATAIYDANYRKIPKLGVILPFDHYDNLLKTDKQVRKETAEKFAERLKAIYIPKLNEWDEIRVDGLVYAIDEVCKEITEGEK